MILKIDRKDSREETFCGCGKVEDDSQALTLALSLSDSPFLVVGKVVGICLIFVHCLFDFSTDVDKVV